MAVSLIRETPAIYLEHLVDPPRDDNADGTSYSARLVDVRRKDHLLWCTPWVFDKPAQAHVYLRGLVPAIQQTPLQPDGSIRVVTSLGPMVLSTQPLPQITLASPPAPEVRPDEAAELAIAMSLHDALQKSQSDLGEIFNGCDNMLRCCMKVARTFESWACAHVAFRELAEVWSYFLEDRFGDACLSLCTPSVLFKQNGITDLDCYQIAQTLHLPVYVDDNVRWPLSHTIELQGHPSISHVTLESWYLPPTEDQGWAQLMADQPVDGLPDSDAGYRIDVLVKSVAGVWHLVGSRSPLSAASHVVMLLFPGIQLPGRFITRLRDENAPPP